MSYKHFYDGLQAQPKALTLLPESIMRQLGRPILPHITVNHTTEQQRARLEPYRNLSAEQQQAFEAWFLGCGFSFGLAYRRAVAGQLPISGPYHGGPSPASQRHAAFLNRRAAQWADTPPPERPSRQQVRAAQRKMSKEARSAAKARASNDRRPMPPAPRRVFVAERA